MKSENRVSLIILLTLYLVIVNCLSQNLEPTTTLSSLSSENGSDIIDTTDVEIIKYDRPEQSTTKLVSKKENLKTLKELEGNADEDNVDEIPVDANDDFHPDVHNDISNKELVDKNEKNQTDSYNEDDDHSEIEGTTTLPLLDNLNITLPPLSRMIDLAEDGELGILNQTQTRRILIDLSSNDEIIGINDINRLLLENDLNHLSNDNSLETDLLSSPIEECGLNRFDNEIPLTERIIGGDDTLIGEIPWMVSVRLTHPNLGQVGHWCGAVLISKNWIASAAHCILNPLFHLPDPTYWQVRLGKHNIRKNEPTEKTYQVSKLFHIKSYRAYDNDLVLLKTDEKIISNDYIRPICLPPNEKFDFSTSSECLVVGWGKNEILKRGTDILQKVKVNIYDNLDCHKVYYPKFRIMIKNWHLCAGNKLGNKGTCHGDSGGGLQCKIGGRFYLAGITSFGSNCAKAGFPDVFTKITYFLNWIKEKIKNE